MSTASTATTASSTPNMSEDEFLAKLKETAKTLSWHVTSASCIRGKFPKGSRLQLCCPITAVLFQASNMVSSLSNPEFASTHLGVDPLLSRRLVAAADNTFTLSTDPGTTRHGRTLRRKLLDAVGLPGMGARK